MPNISLRPGSPLARRVRVWSALLALFALVPALHLLSPSSALASNSQVSIIEEENVSSSPGPVLQELRFLGATEMRIEVSWANIAPDPTSTHRPTFNAADPAAYPAANWQQLDAAVKTASSDGIKILLTVNGAAPAWAQGPGKPGGSLGASLGAWKPSASEFGKFVQALATRYSGHYQGLPGIHTWEIYSEPNFGEHLSPQSVGSVFTGADMYRSLLSAAWNGLRAAKHNGDTVVIGALSAHGQPSPGVAGETRPLQFILELYCLDGRYREFRGHAASQRGCPSTTAAARKFRGQNPGLFSASAFSVHPYPLGVDMTVPPNATHFHDKDYATFSQLPNLQKTLDKAVKTWGSGKKYSIWNTEYGYISNPPRTDGVSLANQAYYLNWAEYLSWKNPRIGSFMNFLLFDPDPTHGVTRYGGFASGLIFNSATPQAGAPKPALDAWRLPLYLPSTSTRKGRTLEVWGCARAAQYAIRDTHQAQVAHVQFAPSGSSTYTNVATITYRNANGSCYFDQHIKFPSSGTVRLAYSYPTGDLSLQPGYDLTYYNPVAPSYSRSISVTIH